MREAVSSTTCAGTRQPRIGLRRSPDSTSAGNHFLGIPAAMAACVVKGWSNGKGKVSSRYGISSQVRMCML